MHDPVVRVLRLAVSGVVFMGYAALATVDNYGGVLLFPAILMIPLAPLGEWMEKNVPIYRTVRLALCIAYGCLIPLTLMYLGLMDAVILLVIFIQIYLMSGIKNERVYYQIILMAFFLLLAAVVQQPNSAIALVLIGFIVGVIWAFATLRIFVERERSSGSRLPDVVTMDGLRYSTGKRSAQVFDFGLILSLSLLSVSAIVLTVVLFLLTPRVEAGLFSREDSSRSITNVTEKVTLDGGTSIYEDPRAVMHVTFPDEPDGAFIPADRLYWRTATLSRFSGAEWSRYGLIDHHQPGITRLSRWMSPDPAVARGKAVEHSPRERMRKVRQVIFMDDVPTQNIPCLDLVQKVTLLSEDRQMTLQWDDGMDFGVSLNTRGPRRISYEVISEVEEMNPDILNRTGWDYSSLPARDKSMLIYQELRPGTIALVKEVVAGKKTPYETMTALNEWLSKAPFSYTLNLPPLPSDHPIDYFLTTSRSGHCELFASALALTARSCGIPARVVSGYRGGEFSVSEQAYTIRASMAHLWVEAYFEGIGWVRFDPSPQVSTEVTGLNRVKQFWSSYLLVGKMFWYQQVMAFRGGWRLDKLFRRHAGPAEASDEAPADVSEESKKRLNLTGYNIFSLWTVGGGLILGSVGGWLLWRRYRRRNVGGWRPRLTASQHRAVCLYRYLTEQLEKCGVNCRDLSTEEILQAAASHSAINHGAVARIIDSYHAARFGAMELDRKRYATLRRLPLRLENGK